MPDISLVMSTTGLWYPCVAKNPVTYWPVLWSNFSLCPLHFTLFLSINNQICKENGQLCSFVTGCNIWCVVMMPKLCVLCTTSWFH
jgi:hypothetical protein